jgi:hypothetical protein
MRGLFPFVIRWRSAIADRRRIFFCHSAAVSENSPFALLDESYKNV